MKELVVVAALAATYPLGRLLRPRPWGPEAAATLLGLLPFLFGLHDYMGINLVSHETYRGDARGFEFAAVDMAAGILWFSLPASPRPPIPYKKVGFFYLAVALLSLAAAAQPLFGLFSVWK